MSRNVIEIGEYTFSDDAIVSGEITAGGGLVAEDLRVGRLTYLTLPKARPYETFITSEDEIFHDSDDLELHVIGEEMDIDMSAFTYGQEVIYRHDNKLVGRYYLQKVQRVAKYTYQIECMDAIGLLTRRKHYGGVYDSNTTVGALIADLMGDIPYSIPDTSISNIAVAGYLPIASRRDNLQELLFAYGISVMYDDDGHLSFMFNENAVPKEVNVDFGYIDDGKVDYLTKATSVRVTEHSYYKAAGVDPVLLYDNTGQSAVDDAVIEFNGPYHTLVPTGLTISESGDNYAVVSGTGTLTGIPYVHIQRELTQETGVVSEEPNEVKVTKATLVNPVNSTNVLARVAEYYSQAEETTYKMVSDGERPGTLLSFINSFGDDASGFIKSQTITMSGILKAEVVVATGWRPNHLGNAFTDSIVITAEDLVGGVYTVPPEYVGQPARIYIFGGGSGGYGSYDGNAGGKSSYAEAAYKTYSKSRNQYTWLPGVVYVPGGEGGAPGAGGMPGKVYSFNEAALDASYSVTLGTGGTGGGANGGADPTAGTDTTFGTHSSSEGALFGGNYVDLITGNVYAKIGKSGLKGGKGGGAGNIEQTPEGYPNANPNFIDYAVFHGTGPNDLTPVGEDGEAAGEHAGGKGSTSVEFSHEATTSTYTMHGCGSGGGGSSQDASGTDATDPTATSYDSPQASFFTTPGDGASAVKPAKATLGSGGDGAGGGGGGGSAGLSYQEKDNANGTRISMTRTQNAGAKGNGAAGGDAGDGFVLIYTTPKEV